MARRKRRDDPNGFGIATTTFMLLTVIFAFAALVVAGTALSNSEDAQDSAAAAGGQVVTLSEFAIEPSMVNAAEGATLTVKNAGTVAHNLAVVGTDLHTPDIPPGASVPQPYQADTIAVAPGERYTVLVHATEPGVWAWHCHILNHAERDNGMFGMVTAFIVQ